MNNEKDDRIIIEHKLMHLKKMTSGALTLYRR
nr:MAG TPA: hypothetical protein [Caudoviricetes sp.]